MKKTLFPFLLALVVLVSCQESEDPIMACGVSDPVENLTWLNEMITEVESGDFAEDSYLVMATYQGQTVFSIGYCCANCLSVYPIYYNCEGEIVEGEAISSNLENSEVIWMAENSTCNFE